MTRKNYIRIAAAFNDARMHVATVPNNETAGFTAGLTAAAKEVARALREDNPRFDTERFMKACHRVK